MKKIKNISLLLLTMLITSSCGSLRQIRGYDNTLDKFNTNLFYANVQLIP